MKSITSSLYDYPQDPSPRTPTMGEVMLEQIGRAVYERRKLEEFTRPPRFNGVGTRPGRRDPPPPAARRSFQQMARLPNYRATRPR